MKNWIYGKNAVYEAVKKNDELDEVVMLGESKDHQLATLCKKNKIKVRYESKDFFYKNAPSRNHQGYLALKKSYDYLSLEEMIERIPQGQQPLLIMLDGLEDPHNLGAIIRTCEAAGVGGIIIPKDRQVGVTSTVVKTSAGAIYNMKLVQVVNLTTTISKLKDHGFWIVGTSLEDSTDYREIDYTGKIVLVIGNEGKGISRLVKESCDFVAKIPMYGTTNSLNASVASGIMIYEVVRNRK